MKIPFFKPSIDQEEIDAVVAVLESGWLTSGVQASSFEKEMAEYIGHGVDAIAVNSATAGLHLALEALGIGKGDEVIVPTLTFTATAEVVRYVGATPILVDSDPVTNNIQVEAIAQKITPQTKCILPVHFAGLPCDMDAILQLAKQHSLFVVEDAAHALSAKYKGTKIGALESDCTVFSFYANKNITTGEGGMMVSRNPKLIERARVMRTHGIDRDAMLRFAGGSWEYDIVDAGFKYNLTDIAAAIGRVQLEKVDLLRDQRRALAEKYNWKLGNLPLDLPTMAGQQDLHAWHIYPVRLNKGLIIERNDLFVEMQESGISCSVHYRPLHMMKYWSSFEQNNMPYVNATDHFERTISLPFYPSMTGKEVDQVVKVLAAKLAMR